MEYKIMLEAFEGPMDLLLHLIEESKIDIYDIPINEITEQYLDYINKMGDMDLEVTSEFLIMASTLLEIKSKMLLPQIDKVNNEVQLEMEEADPRLELIRNLLEYKKFKLASKKLQEYEKTQSKVFFKPTEDLTNYSTEEFDLKNIDISKLVNKFKKLIVKNKEEKVQVTRKIQSEEYTLVECILNIKNKLNKKKRVFFSQLFSKDTSKKEKISTFVSLLELIKNKHVTVHQGDNFEEILINKKAEEGEKTDG